MNAYIKALPLPVAIIGMGKTGTSVKKLLLKAGLSESQIFTFDEKSSSDFSTEIEILRAEPKTLVVSPGVSLKKKFIQELSQMGALITSEINIASHFLDGECLIGVTGSIGKSTTTAALGSALSAIDPNCFFGGNLGTPFAEYALKTFDPGFQRAKYIVLELSSYQLENSKDLALDYGIITYLSPNHLERYEGLDEYYMTKWQMIDQTKLKVFANALGGDLSNWAQKHTNPKVFLINPLLDFPKEDWSVYRVLGEHNQQNLSLCLKVLQELMLPSQAHIGLQHFSGLSHRMENLGSHREILFVNDSKATSLDSVRTAMNSCLEFGKGRLWLMLGGRDKNLPWNQIRDFKSHSLVEFIFFGEARQIIQGASGLPGPAYSSLKDALDHVKLHATSGDTVLLSPGGTSLDEFPNFEARGDFFRKYVQENFI